MYSDTVVVALKRPDHVFAVAYAVEPSASVCKTFRLKVKLPRQIVIRCDYTPVERGKCGGSRLATERATTPASGRRG